MTNEGKPKNEKINDIDQEMLNFGAFVDEHHYSADQIREAYYRHVGVIDEGEIDPEVAVIQKKMDEMSKRGFPLNRFSEIIEFKQEHEDAAPKFYSYVDTLDISANEKKVLGSIVDKQRSGEVVCCAGDKIVADFEVDFEGLGKAIVATEFLEKIKKIVESLPKGVKYEFTFSER
jgi:hypothetical protein